MNHIIWLSLVDQRLDAYAYLDWHVDRRRARAGRSACQVRRLDVNGECCQSSSHLVNDLCFVSGCDYACLALTYLPVKISWLLLYDLRLSTWRLVEQSYG